MSFYLTTIVALLVCFALYYFTTAKFSRYKQSTKFTLIPENGSSENRRLNSLPAYYGYLSIIYSFVPTVLLAILAFYLFPKAGIKAFTGKYNSYLFLGILALFSIAAYYIIKPKFRARETVESYIKLKFIAASLVAVLITLLIFVSVFYESIKFFEKSSFIDFFFGLEWSPQTAMRVDQAGSSGKFGIIPVFAGTFLITLIAMAVATPLGLLSAIYLSQYASKAFRNYIKPILEILAGVPTVVYGYFAAVTMGPSIRNFCSSIGLDVASESALSAGLVMGIMIIPFIMSLSDDVMNAVPKSLSDASLGLGSTKSETIRKVIIPSSLPGIVSAVLLAISRAIGETMIVTMAAGLIAKLTLNPFESVTTVTAQIVKLLVGDQEFDSAKTLAAFALSLTLFLVTLALNIAALIIVKKYREKYE